jgi:hypothetical protein
MDARCVVDAAGEKDDEEETKRRVVFKDGRLFSKHAHHHHCPHEEEHSNDEHLIENNPLVDGCCVLCVVCVGGMQQLTMSASHVTPHVRPICVWIRFFSRVKLAELVSFKSVGVRNECNTSQRRLR